MPPAGRESPSYPDGRPDPSPRVTVARVSRPRPCPKLAPAADPVAIVAAVGIPASLALWVLGSQGALKRQRFRARGERSPSR